MRTILVPAPPAPHAMISTSLSVNLSEDIKILFSQARPVDQAGKK
jgi:hypothetical protein